MLGQYGHEAEDQREFAILGAAEIETDRAFVEGFGLRNLGIILAMVGAPLVTQQGPRKKYVLGSHRLAIGETSVVMEMEGDVAPWVVGLHAICQQPVKGESFVMSSRHQAFDHKAPDL